MELLLAELAQKRSATIAGLLLIQNGSELGKMSLGLFGITFQLPRSFFSDVIG